MTKTEYLTGYTSDRYAQELIPLVAKRVSDMRKMLTVLRTSMDGKERTGIAYHKTIERYQKIDQAIDWWQELLED